MRKKNQLLEEKIGHGGGRERERERERENVVNLSFVKLSSIPFPLTV